MTFGITLFTLLKKGVSYIHETPDIRPVTKDLKLSYDLYNKLVEQYQDSQYALVRQNKVVSRLMCVLDTLRDTARPRINNKDLFNTDSIYSMKIGFIV